MDEAIASAMAGDAVYPDGSVFVAAEMPGMIRVLRGYIGQGRPVVVVFEDGRTAIMRPPSEPRESPGDRLAQSVKSFRQYLRRLR